MTDIPGNSTTTATIRIGESVTGSLETAGDRDWFRLELVAGQSVTIALNGSGATPVSDVYLRVRDANGVQIFENDDGGPGLNSLLSFTATRSGTYFIDVGAFGDNLTGGYQLLVNPYSAPPLWTVNQIADQLVFGYWDGASRSWGISQGSSLTVNISALTADGQFFAREALGMWSDVTGIRFVEVTGSAQITIDDAETGAAATSVVSAGRITSSRINIGTEWIQGDGRNLNSYSFQTYIHEIGHALGLGHAGDYNDDATYISDAMYRNDSWAVSIMSYFDQRENSYFRDQGFTLNYILSPQVADVLAMSMLYGLSTTTRLGDTTYGFNSNAGRAVFDARQYPTGSYTIFDSGGIDTLDYSQFSNNQTINLNSNTFSNVGSSVGNVAIAIGTVIENAMGGSGSDRLIGNEAANRLVGGAGDDQLTGASGNDTLLGGSGNDWLFGGLGSDVLDGDAGFDVAFYDSFFRSSVVAFSNGVGTIDHRSDGSRDRVQGVDLVEFGDGLLVFDPNGAAAQVARLYDGVLARAPDVIGFDFWVDRIEDRGATLKSVAEAFLGSAELRSLMGGADMRTISAGEYVAWLYQHMLGRPADAGGLNYWTGQLAAGRDRADLLVSFSESVEHRGLTAGLVSRGFFNTDDDYQTVALLYNAFGRLPDGGGLTYWAELLESGARSLDQIADSFASSNEFRGLTAGMNNSQIVDFLYRTMLDRAPDAGALNYWTNQLNSGMDQGDLLLAFSQSPEHVGLLSGSIVGGIELFGP